MKIFHTAILFCLLNTSSALFAKAQSVDGIAAVVNDTIITKSELEQQLHLMEKQMRQSARVPLNEKALEKQVLEDLITKEVQLSLAKKTGIQIEESELDRTIEDIARQHHMTMSQLRETLDKDGIDFATYRTTIRNQMAINQLQQRDVLGGIHVSEQEINQFLQSPNGLGEVTNEYRLMHLLIPLAENASKKEIDDARHKANEIVKQLRSGKDFAQLALNDANDLGWHKLPELPTLFDKVVPSLKLKEIANPIHSGSGFHIIKLLDKRTPMQAQASNETSLVRHILIKTNSTTSDQDAKRRLNTLREKIKKGGDFAELAKTHSTDLGSSSNGGSIGWVTKDALVPEFRNQMQKLPINEISEPFKTAFGWHIIQVQERKTQSNEQMALRQKAKEMIRQRKAQEKVQNWVRQLRDEAYVKTVYDS